MVHQVQNPFYVKRNKTSLILKNKNKTTNKKTTNKKKNHFPMFTPIL